MDSQQFKEYDMGKNTEINFVGQPIFGQVYSNSTIITNHNTEGGNVKKAFSTVAIMVRIHLINLIDVYGLLRNITRTYAKKKPDDLLPSLFPDFI